MTCAHDALGSPTLHGCAVSRPYGRSLKAAVMLQNPVRHPHENGAADPLVTDGARPLCCDNDSPVKDKQTRFWGLIRSWRCNWLSKDARPCKQTEPDEQRLARSTANNTLQLLKSQRAAHLWRQRMAASRHCRFSAFRSDLMTDALRRRSPTARTAPSKNGSTDARGTCGTTQVVHITHQACT